VRIVLIGPRGAGKSSVAKALALRLGLPCVDTDARIEEQSGRSIAALLADGSFRRLEREAVADALRLDAAVVAVGGGAVLWDGFAGAAAGWTVVALDAASDVLARRIREDECVRPSLTGEPADEEIATVAKERAERYAALAHFSVATDNFDVGEVVEVILGRSLSG
jgi:shikimate kinase